MKVGCVPHPQIPGATALFLDYLYAYEKVRSFYPHSPLLSGALESSRSLQFPRERRSKLCEGLRNSHPRLSAAQRASLQLLGQPETAAVVSGQQVGLFGGPLYALYKALTAVKVAERLTAEGRPAAPVFWLATEDHDLAEIDHTWVAGSEGQPLRIGVQGEEGRARPVGGVAPQRWPLEELERALAGPPFAGETLELLKRAYQPGRSFGDSFRELFQELLAPYGMLFLSPMDGWVRRLGAPLIDRSLENLSALLEALGRRGADLEAAGYHQQVAVSQSASLLFLIENGRRAAMKRAGERLSANGKELSIPEARAKLSEAPESFSPNAVLRPVFQDFVLPTAAYVAGPAEIAYFAQSSVLYRPLLGRMPAILPRGSYTVLEARTLKVLEKYGLSVRDCLQHEQGLRQHLAAKLTPPELSGRLNAEQERIGASLDGIEQELAAFDPTLRDAFLRSRRKIQYQLSKTARKAERASFLRDGYADRDASYLFQFLYPHRRLQERLYGFPALYARFGPKLIEAVYQSADPDCLDHQVLAP